MECGPKFSGGVIMHLGRFKVFARMHSNGGEF